MPSGLAHRRLALSFLLLLLAAVVYTYDDLILWFGADPVFEYLLLFVVSFLVGTYLLSPDLDLSDSDPSRSWGIARVIWRPYAAVFRHRGWSHTPVVGTLTRVLYLGAIALLALSLVEGVRATDDSELFPVEGVMISSRSLCVFAGLVLSDIVHVWADRFFGK